MTSKFEQMGIAAMLPGLQWAIEILQSQLDRMREQLQALQDGTLVSTKKIDGRGNASAKFWAKLSPEERAAESKRRNDKRVATMLAQAGGGETLNEKRRRAAQLGGLAKAAKISKAERAALAKGYWDRMTPEQRKAEVARRAAVAMGKAASRDKDPGRRKLVGKKGGVMKGHLKPAKGANGAAATA